MGYPPIVTGHLCPVSETETASTDAEVGGPNFFTSTVTATAGVSASSRAMTRSARVSRSLYETRVPSSTTSEASWS